MQYAIRHITQFTYKTPVSESRMEVRMCPRTDAQQQCYSFELSLTPHAQLFVYQDFMGNHVHHFDIPGRHDSLTLESRALVDVRAPSEIPPSLPESAWEELDGLYEEGTHLEMTMPSAYTHPTEALRALGEELRAVRRDDPLRLLRELNEGIYRAFEYSSESTHVNSPIDDALTARGGVCQDFAHIFIALARGLQIPARYVSGYLFHRTGGPDGGDRSARDGSHAWAEAFLPPLGWIGFDPTNNILAGERHIRVALGRDYADVPPTRGVYKGKGSSRSTLHVGVHVAKAQFRVRDDVMPEMARVTQRSSADTAAELEQEQEQQQQ